MPTNKKAYDGNQISMLFGLNTNNYNLLMEILTHHAVKDNSNYIEAFNAWKLMFNPIYGTILNKDLFLKHTYYVLILKFLLTLKLKSLGYSQDLDLSAYFMEENKIFNWIEISHPELPKHLDLSSQLEFKEEDLFNNLYQELIFPTTRHLRGEYYTGTNLARNMTVDSFKFGDRVLDPSCGSGIFIIETLKAILNSKKEYSEKLQAIHNVYGFDINPLAIFTCKINYLLILSNHLKAGDLSKINLNLKCVDSLFPDGKFFEKVKHSFDLVLGNPPWLTYKDLKDKNYQEKIRTLANELEIKPPSQYTTHIELAAIFFYSIPTDFLKINGKIFFVITKSILNGDHCYKFRIFNIFKDLEIWDFPDHYFFNIKHICLKATYTGKNDRTKISEKYPIPTKIFNDSIELQKEIYSDSVELNEDGARIILPLSEIKKLRKSKQSVYKNQFLQGATLVPRTLVFFEIEKKDENYYTIVPDLEVLSRAKKNWRFPFGKTKIEKNFRYRTFLNKDLLPFCVKRFRNIFIPINRENFQYDRKLLEKNPFSYKFYTEQDAIYKKHKKATSSINTLFENLNYWNKLTKQSKNKTFIVVYNASGSSLKSAVIINDKKKIIIGSENYYFSTSSQYEAYYLSAILNSPVFSKNIKLIKSSRHIHKRPFSFPIPQYNDDNPIHRNLGTKAKKYHTVVRDLVLNNPKISPEKVRMFINPKLVKLDALVNQIVFD